MRTEAIDHTHQYLRGPASSEAHRIIDSLRDAGFVAFLAGGCVRDALLGIEPKDYDVATDATPKSIRKVFGKSKTLAFGASFGVIGVLPERTGRSARGDSVLPTEVATFRSDGYYSDGRRPDSVHYGDAKNDALRRDFTINGLFYDPREDEVVDYVGGQADLDQGLLRTIGNPLERFGEDKLRMLRAVRFATTLGFKIDGETQRAIIEHAVDIAVVSGERIGAEMRRVLTSQHADQGLRHLQACRLEQQVLPELHSADPSRLESLMHHAAARNFPLSLACVVMAMADPLDSLRSIAARWRLSNEEVRKATAAITHWATIASAADRPWSEVQPLLVNRDAATIVQLAATIVAADGQSAAGITLASEALKWPPERLDPEPLLTGDDLRDLGIPAGPQYRTILQSMRAAQLDGEIRSRDDAIGRLQN